MTNSEILRIAMRQSAIDSGCLPEDFEGDKHKIVLSRKDGRARKYLDLPFLCDFTSYGNCVVASVSEELRETAEEFLSKYPAEHCFETPNLVVLQEKLQKFDMNVCFMAEYFLPDTAALTPLSCGYEIRLLRPADFAGLYLPQWSNALCEKRKQLDVLAAAAFDGGEIVGLAGCSADCEEMRQIGVDVLPAYRRKGVASALTSLLARELLRVGKVPFYCCAWSNVRSARTAIRSGFRPAWVQLTVKKNAFIAELNK